MGKAALANHLNGFELIQNGDFNPPNPAPGTFTSTLSLDGWTLGGGGKGPVIPAEIISGPYAGMPAGHHYLDTEASPGATVIGQTIQTGPNQPMHLDLDVFYQTFGGAAHTNMADSLEIDLSGTGFGGQTLVYSFASLFGTEKAGGLPAPGSHAHISLDFIGAENGSTGLSIHEVGPGAATGNIGVGLTGVRVQAYDVFNGQHF